ncbi:MAG: hybrid sensor histidine kinase/response regulator, partial [Promethearchaeota archaeon]
NGKNYHLEKTNIIFNPTDVKFAFPKNATLNSQLIPRIDYWLKQLKNTPNSIYYTSFEQHFSGEPSIVTKIPTWVYTVVITILSITGLLFASSLILRRQIRLKTHNLVVVNEELKTDIAKRREIEMDLRQAQKRYKLLVEQIPIGIIEWDTNLNVIGWNKGAEKIFGIKTENALQRNCLNLGESNLFSEEPILANKKNEISAILQELIEKPSFIHSQHKFDIRDPTTPKNHNEIITEWISTSLVGSDKSIIALISFVQDITEKISKDKEQIKIQKLQSIALLAGGIAHDFNNILVGILGNANLLQMEVPGSEDYQEYLTDLINAVQVAKGLTQQLLTFSKGGDPIKKTLSLIPILQDAISFSTHGAKSSVILDIRGENPVSDLDPGQISQVFNNLIINALQAMPNGGTITITTNIVQSINTHKIPLAQGKYIEITVKDEGIGIPEKFQNKIFEPYFTTKPKGNGIGLATCFSIIKKHQGFITFTSKPNEGTTFYVYLPVSKPAIQKEEEVSKKRNHFSGKILLMDDDKQVRNVLGKMLEHTGLEVEYSDNGEQTVKKFNFAIEKKIPYSLIILDLTIRGGMGGQETIKQIREIDPNIKAIVSSGYSNSPVMAQFQQFGFDAVLKKPYSYDELLNILSKLL